MKKSLASTFFCLWIGFAGKICAQEICPPEPIAELPAGEVIVMDKRMFVERVCNYEIACEEQPKWTYLGNLPAVIDLYADWCGPCRMIAPIMEELAQTYQGQVIFYKVNIDRERELAVFWGATSIPLIAFIPMKGEPVLFRGAADKETYRKYIDYFLLGKH